MKRISSLRWLHAPALMLALLFAGCGSDSPMGEPKVDEDAGADAGLDAGGGDAGDGGSDAGDSDAGDSDAGGSDAGDVDAGLDDAGVDVDGSTADAGVDADVPDADVPMDAGTSTDGGPRPPVCEPGTACGAGDSCGDGETCIVNACGIKVCQARSAFCVSSDECAAGSACTTTAIGDLCTPTNGEVCNASTDCPVSHVCEGAAGSRSCVLRRLPCFDESDCPVSYMCLGVAGDSAACQYAYRPCDSVGTCALSVCSDIDGNGSTECGAGGACETNAECSAPERCMNLNFSVQCGLGGLCNQSGGDACASGWECLDLRGDGYGECAPQGGSCTSHLDCPGGGLCAVPLDRSPPRCTYPL